jgi:hypothetical protein
MEEFIGEKTVNNLNYYHTITCSICGEKMNQNDFVHKCKNLIETPTGGIDGELSKRRKK